MSRLTFILGGARSGKSELALRMAVASARPVTYIATALPGDDEMAARIADHQAQRPSSWTTIEEPLAISGALRKAGERDFIILDCLTLWVSNLILEGATEYSIIARLTDVLESHARTPRHLCIVSNEVGLGIVPDNPLARAYRDALGRANRAVAAAAERTLLVVAGLALDLKPAGARPIEDFGRLPTVGIKRTTPTAGGQPAARGEPQDGDNPPAHPEFIEGMSGPATSG